MHWTSSIWITVIVAGLASLSLLWVLYSQALPQLGAIKHVSSWTAKEIPCPHPMNTTACQESHCNCRTGPEKQLYSQSDLEISFAAALVSCFPLQLWFQATQEFTNQHKHNCWPCVTLAQKLYLSYPRAIPQPTLHNTITVSLLLRQGHENNILKHA